MSKVNPLIFPKLTDLDYLLPKLRAQLAIIRDEITALEQASGITDDTYVPSFWFGSLAASDLTGSWSPLPIASGGMTGNPDSATADTTGLTLNVEAVVQLRLWVEFADPGTGDQQIALQITETGTPRLRGQSQLVMNQTMMMTAYDGWLNPGVLISPAGFTSAAGSLLGTSYITAIVTPT